VSSTKYIFVTGGVVSSLGKGIAAASLGRLLVVTAQAAEPNSTFKWNPQGIEISILLALVLGMTFALVLWRRFYGRRAAAEE